ncbi:uncharacterized protein P174DRAFT_292253 [Aspergillus novofumigatus IBT 16806]|uniref:Uncharacterized protein n=1 Tax=Aspergillus novofumigatus (strain IBT 16806) TaxID=1392255 RepID=A0A2I1BY38_ASPN1|nr:uncharacterized protein P174DRAFT_292253 [Aspergillus novofumigatus IBT 16806]PKX90261.1 hypothetical protein P174DRAFT_292253 [Aspergillus novofumigatus IBT 16806]
MSRVIVLLEGWLLIVCLLGPTCRWAREKNIPWNSKPPGIISPEIEAEVKPKYQGFDGRTRVSTQSVQQSVLKTFMPYLHWLFPFPHSCLLIFKNSVLLLFRAMYLFAIYWVCNDKFNIIWSTLWELLCLQGT